MIYFLLTLLVILVAIWMQRLRIKLSLDSEGENRLFVGLGSFGIRYDFSENRSDIVLSGWRMKRLNLDKREKKRKKKAPDGDTTKSFDPLGLEIIKKISKYIRELPAAGTAQYRYFSSLIKSVVVEQANGKVRAGFDQPDLTGLSYGLYQAVLGVEPDLAERFAFAPVWDEASFDGSLNLAIALPFHRFGWRTIVMIKDLPVMKIVKLAIGKKEGVKDD